MSETSIIRSVRDQVEEALRTRVNALRAQGEHRLPSEPALAAELGVSRDTVRQALSQLAGERLVDRQPGRGTFIRPETEAKTVCLLVSGHLAEMYDPVRSAVMHGACLAIDEMDGAEIRFAPMADSEAPGVAERLIRMARNLKADGYLAAVSLRVEECRRILAANIPFVTTYNYFRCNDVPAALMGHYAGGVLAGKYLAERGSRRIALITRTMEGDRLRLAEQLLAGMSESLGDRTPRPGDMLVGEGYDEELCRKAMGRLLDREDPPDTIMVTSDHRVVGALAALRERGLDGSRDPFLLPYLETPAIAPGVCIALPSRTSLGRRAARLLCRLIAGEDVEKRVEYLPPRLLIR